MRRENESTDVLYRCVCVTNTLNILFTMSIVYHNNMHLFNASQKLPVVTHAKNSTSELFHFIVVKVEVI